MCSSTALAARWANATAWTSSRARCPRTSCGRRRACRSAWSTSSAPTTASCEALVTAPALVAFTRSSHTLAAYELGRPVGLYPETKHPSYFRAIGLPLEAPLVSTLRAAKLDKQVAGLHPVLRGGQPPAARPPH